MKKIFLAVVVVGVSLFFGFLIGRSSVLPPSLMVPGDALGVESGTRSAASLMLDFGDGHVIVYPEIPLVAGETLIKLLEKQTKAVTLNFTTKKYASLGVLVESIGSKTNGEGGKYWQYWVNNTALPYGADQYKVQPGDVIEWKFLNYK